jgi:DNA-binding ferritin-like protein (Dps family)
MRAGRATKLPAMFGRVYDTNTGFTYFTYFTGFTRNTIIRGILELSDDVAIENFYSYY